MSLETVPFNADEASCAGQTSTSSVRQRLTWNGRGCDV